MMGFNSVLARETGALRGKVVELLQVVEKEIQGVERVRRKVILLNSQIRPIKDHLKKRLLKLLRQLV